tara:strand:- start:879 stop:1121 length:243 start_codon:yes stop_codon:yes gene_type:complete
MTIYTITIKEQIVHDVEVDVPNEDMLQDYIKESVFKNEVPTNPKIGYVTSTVATPTHKNDYVISHEVVEHNEYVEDVVKQ